ncbi:MAG: nickel pincer cofactor biosynthesis protein LarC [Actinobacteria bacterium]|nr:nickel pincer cofactor biosynthesis protein LarC [Actinomycetota bacterium]
MRVLYFDCIAGISGDMALGALIDAGADLDGIRKVLATLPVEPFDVEVERVDAHGIGATKVLVEAPAGGVIRTYANIRSLVEGSDLPPDAKDLAQRIFRRLAEAEAIVHRRDVEQVTFHEVGAVDSIVDICGVAVALTMLGVERAFSSAVPTGFGMVRTEHGSMPIPAPAVVELLRGAPMYSRGVPVELVTPTGAAILTSTVEGFGEMPAMRIDAVGYGAGSHRTDFPNVLRVLLGEEVPAGRGSAAETPASGELVLETNVDDLNPELYGYVLERLFEAGAQDAWLTPIVMKKGRAAVTISVLCSPQQQDAMRRVLFRETGTLGIRAAAVSKQALDREWIEVSTRYGRVRVKVGLLDDAPVTVAPEFEDCAAVAREAGVPARDVYEEAARLARDELARRDAT